MQVQSQWSVSGLSPAKTSILSWNGHERQSTYTVDWGPADVLTNNVGTQTCRAWGTRAACGHGRFVWWLAAWNLLVTAALVVTLHSYHHSGRHWCVGPRVKGTAPDITQQHPFVQYQRTDPWDMSMLAVEIVDACAFCAEGACLVVTTVLPDRTLLPLHRSQRTVAVKATGIPACGRTPQHAASGPCGAACPTLV